MLYLEKIRQKKETLAIRYKEEKIQRQVLPYIQSMEDILQILQVFLLFLSKKSNQKS